MERRRVLRVASLLADQAPSDDCRQEREEEEEEGERETMKEPARILFKKSQQQNNDNGFNVTTPTDRPPNSSCESARANNHSSGGGGNNQQRSWRGQTKATSSTARPAKQIPFEPKTTKTTTTTTTTSKYLQSQRANGRPRVTPCLLLALVGWLLLTVQPNWALEESASVGSASGESPAKDLIASASKLSESLVASEQRVEQQQLAYAPPVDPTESSAGQSQNQNSSNNSDNNNSPATTLPTATETAAAADQQQQQPQQHRAEDVPAVSGLFNQHEEQQQQQPVDQQTGGAGDAQQQPESEQRPAANRQQPAVDAEQQQQILVDEPENEPSRLSRPQQQSNGAAAGSGSVSGADNNDVGDHQSARKASVSLEQQPQQQQQSKRGGRTLKRAFGGHAGIFGRKQRPSSPAEDLPQQQIAEQQQQQQVEQQTTTSTRAQRGRDYHYYYTVAPAATKSGPPKVPKLKEADYPNDYREILIQPDRQQTGRAREQPEQEEQQPASGAFEQSHIQVDEPAPAPAATTTESPQPTLNVLDEPDSSPPKSGPYIRLSNIATINSTANQAASNGSSEGEMKLMRIYVIDLDQKLVVGSQQQQQPAAHESGSQSAEAAGKTSSNSLEQIVTGAIAHRQQQQQQQEQQHSGEQMNARSSEPHQSTVAMASSSESPLLAEAITERYLVDQPQQHAQPVQQQQQLVNYTIDHSLPIAGAAGHLQPAPEAHQYVMTVPAQHSLMAYPASDNASAAHYYNSSLGSSYYNQGSAAATFGQEQVDDRNQPQQPGVAVYLQPVPLQQAQPPQQQQLTYPVVPQYIAPQYNAAANTRQASSSHPDKEQYHQVAAGQSSSGALGSHSSSPGASQRQQHGNYTSRLVQAPGRLARPAGVVQAQDKHHANLNVYQQHSSDEPVYQQQQQQQQPADYSPAQSSEPAQNHRKQQQQQQQYNEPAYKVTTTTASEQHWKPVDYLAPASAYSQTAGHHQQAPIKPAQQQQQPYAPINGYSAPSSDRDHDVVSLANGSLALRHQPTNYQVELVQAANYSAADQQQQPHSFDGQHAPQLNYQARRKQQQQQPMLAYVNNSQAEDEYSSSSAAVYPQPGQQQQQHQQVLLSQSSVSTHHPSSSSSSYNGTATVGWQPADPEQHSYEPAQPPTMTNEYPSMAKLSGHYGSGSEAAYGKHSGANHKHSGEAPRIPHAQSAAPFVAPPRHHGGAYNQHNQQQLKQQTPPSAYLAVNGPPISDGVYESAALEQPRHKPKVKAQRRPAAATKTRHRPAGHNRQNRPRDHDGQLAVEQAEQYIAESAAGHQQPYRGAPYAGGPRAPLAAMASSLYRAPGGGGGPKSFLSWETISSVASGAAKRLPSLSSILSPFGGAVKQSYPTANYAGLGLSSGHKSAHYDRDVSAFHRPYPLRHTNQGFLASYNENPGHHEQPNHYQPQNHFHHHHHHQQQQQPAEAPDSPQSSGYESVVGGQSDLASSSSSEDSETQTDNADSEPVSEDNSSQQQPKTIKLLQVTNSSGVIEASSELPSSAYNSKDESSDSPIGDLAELSPDSVQQQQQLKSPRGSPKKRPRARPSTASEPEASFGASYQPAADGLEPSQAAVLSSIEHQLEEAQPPASSSSAPRPPRKSPKHKQTASSYLEPTITASSASGAGEEEDERAPLSFDSLPADQQRLLLLGQSKGGSKVRFPSEVSSSSPDGLLYGQDGRPIGLPSASNRLTPQQQQQQQGHLTSMQIGQYKITPQTQFVQSIIEPSRQVLGQYFKQYIGQLGQLAHG